MSFLFEKTGSLSLEAFLLGDFLIVVPADLCLVKSFLG